MKVFYDERQQVNDNTDAFSPSAGKPKFVLASWQKKHNVEVMPVTPLTKDEICLSHSSDYVYGVLSCKLRNGFGNKLPSVAKSLLWTTGSFASASIYAYNNKECTFSPTSGFHHACYRQGGGFCTFSGLTIAAIILHRFYGAKRIGIVDLDSHWGNGTQNTIDSTGSGSFIQHYSLGYYDVDESNNKDWLKSFPTYLKDNFSDCDIILYQAGADCHKDDPLVSQGYFSDDQIYERDKTIFEFSKETGIPVTSNLAGGYQEPIEKVIKIHDYLAQAYHDVFK